MAKIEIKYITKSVPLLLDKKEKHDTKNFWELRGIDLAVSSHDEDLRTKRQTNNGLYHD